MFSRNVNTKEKGFTLIEMLVSIALFSVVLTVTLGSIITIADSNKKARSLMSVMNNLNFAVDAVTRSIKSGSNLCVGQAPCTGTSNASGRCVTSRAVDYSAVAADPNAREWVTYCFVEGNSSRGGYISKQDTRANGAIELTSPDVDIQYLQFIRADGTQPRVIVKMEGEVKVSERVSSKFSIQTTVSQRQLVIPGSTNP